MFHITPVENLDSILTHGLVPTIGENSTELGEDTARVYLFSDYTALEDATWFWELFEDDQNLVILEVDTTDIHMIATFSGDYSWEYTTTETISPELITVKEYSFL